VTRFFAPTVAFAVAGYVASVNAQADGYVLKFVGMDYFVGPDLVAQGRLTWQLLVGFGVVTLALAIRATLRSKAD